MIRVARFSIYVLALVHGLGCRPNASVPAQNSPPVVPATDRVPSPELPKDEKLAATIKELSSEDVEVRRTAAYALGQRSGDEALTALLAALDDPDLYVRVYTIQSLRDRRDPRAVDRLCEILKKQSSEKLIVSNVTRALGAIKSPAAVPTLVELLHSEDPFTRYDAAFALGEIGDPSAIPELEKLVSDQTKPISQDPLGAQGTIYTVGEQAERALKAIRGK